MNLTFTFSGELEIDHNVQYRSEQHQSIEDVLCAVIEQKSAIVRSDSGYYITNTHFTACILAERLKRAFSEKGQGLHFQLDNMEADFNGAPQVPHTLLVSGVSSTLS